MGDVRRTVRRKRDPSVKDGIERTMLQPRRLMLTLYRVSLCMPIINHCWMAMLHRDAGLEL